MGVVRNRARKLEIDTVCLLTVGRYDWGFGFSWLFPIWKTETVVLYALRVLRAASGKLLRKAVRERSTGGFYAITTPARLSRELAAELADVLSPILVPPEPQVLALKDKEPPAPPR
jgi:hypothetical protein